MHVIEEGRVPGREASLTAWYVERGWHHHALCGELVGEAHDEAKDVTCKDCIAKMQPQVPRRADIHDLVMRLAKGDDEWWVYDSCWCFRCSANLSYDDATDEQMCEHEDHCPVPELLLYIQRHKDGTP